MNAFLERAAEFAIIPVYNTRTGRVKEYSQFMVDSIEYCHWVDNIILPIHLSLAAKNDCNLPSIDTIVGRNSVFHQCREYLDSFFPDVTLIASNEVLTTFEELSCRTKKQIAVLESDNFIKENNLQTLVREVVSHNKTRFAVIARKPSQITRHDATALISRPLEDRVGLLADIMGEFTHRGINIIDLQSENDIKTQKLQIYLEIEGHQNTSVVKQALDAVENRVIQVSGSINILGSFPRVDMRTRNIKSFGFIGSGAMSLWFAERLENEGYTTIVTGRTSQITPAEMIPQVDVVMICVPISVTAKTIRQYGPKLKEGQALIILAGESENTINAAIEATDHRVEIMFVHNLWGPQALTMKDKNASIVRTHRSGSFCSEFESFLYKHGADIYQDNALKHDLLMGVGQKLPTTVSVALGMTLREHNIQYTDISSHSTLTSLYGILAMARIHNQNPRTYAEIMATRGEGRKIVRSFAENILKIIDLAENGQIESLNEIMLENKSVMPKKFLENRMKEARAVDEILSKPGIKTA